VGIIIRRRQKWMWCALLLARSLAIVGNTGGTIAGLLLDRAEYRRFVIAARTVTIGPTIFANVAMLTEFGDIDRKPLQLVITMNAC
jgi:hypothetical protein